MTHTTAPQAVTPAPDIVERVLAARRSDDCVAIVTETTQANMRWAHNALTTNGQMHDRTLTVIAIRRTGEQAAVGVVTRKISSDDDVDSVRQAAEAAAADAPPSEDAGPLPAATTDGSFADPHEATSIEVLRTFAGDLGGVFEQARGAEISVFGFAEHIVTTTWLGTSTGIRRRHTQPTGRLELNAKDRAMKRTAWLGEPTRDFTDIELESLWPRLRQRYDWTARTLDLPAGRHETLLPPSAVADLMIYAYWSAGWRNAEEGRSAFAVPGGGTRIGERLGSMPWTLTSDPAAPGLETVPFAVARGSAEGVESVFDNGADVNREDWIRDGVINELVATTAVGRQSGRGAHLATDNLTLDTGSTTGFEEMIASTERGLLLTCLWYIREVDPQTLLLTGLTRDGVYQVENGEVTGAVNNFRFNESPIDLLRRATEASQSTLVLPREWNDWFARAQMPALRIPDYNMSTVSQAS